MQDARIAIRTSLVSITPFSSQTPILGALISLLLPQIWGWGADRQNLMDHIRLL